MRVSQQSQHQASKNESRVRRSPRRAAIACAWLLTVLLAIPGLALALGLGQIVVKSAPGEPFLAEIPIVAANPAELEDLRVRLASPETFRRIGLQPPDATLTALQFTVALDAQGRPVIRVTSAAPPSGPLLTFLLEVDWGEGRLVREYSALLDTPETLAAPVQSIQAPAVAPANTIARPQETPTSEPSVSESTPVAEPEVRAEALPPVEPAPAPAIAAAPAQAPEPVESEPAEPAPVLPPESDYRVQAGETLSEIASGLERRGRTLDQTMLALLRANPDAFIGGNVNLVRAGAVLRMPPAEELSRYSVGEAAAMVRTQVAQWREARATRLQAQAATAATVAGAATASMAVPEAARGNTEARLEIVPAVSGAGEAGTRSGIQAGGEGQMLRQEIQQTQETLAARDAELGELKARVAELEKIQEQQQQLIAMKDTALATARENLASAQQAPAAQATDGVTLWPWMLLGLALALLAGWWFVRRRGAAPRPRLFDSAAMAASVPSTSAKPPPAPAPTPSPAPTPAPAPPPAPPVAEASPVPHWTAAPALVGTVPAEDLSPARQVELARAYLDLGDTVAAQDLLREVMDGSDPVAREIAARMLRETE